MFLKSQKGYSLVEIGVGLVIIAIFMICGVTLVDGTLNTYRLVEQKNMAMTYLVKAMEIELLDLEHFAITEDPDDTVRSTDYSGNRIATTAIPHTDIVITTKIENLPSKNGTSYETSRVKLLTGNAEFYIRKNDESSKRVLTLKTLKIEGSEA